MYRWELDGPAQDQFSYLNPAVRASLAAFMDAVVIVDPVQYQRHRDERDDVSMPLRTLHFGAHDEGLVTFLVLHLACGLTRIRAEQIIELVEQGTKRVPGSDDLAVRLRDHGLPPSVSGPDNDCWIVQAEPIQAKHLVILVRYKPQPARCSLVHFVPPGARRICPATRLENSG
jgi:hypothetical protein